jgi:hypothetical protein
VVNGNANEDEGEDEARWPPRAGPTELPNVAPNTDPDTTPQHGQEFLFFGCVRWVQMRAIVSTWENDYVGYKRDRDVTLTAT